MPMPSIPTDREPALPPAVGSMTLLAAAVIVHDEAGGRVLLLQRGPGAKFGFGCWGLPVGKADPGEPVVTTAVRELREETGVVVAPEDLRLAHVVHGARGVESPDGFVSVVFAASRWRGEPVNAEPAKHTRVAWHPVDALPEPLVAGTALVLRRHLAGEVALSLEGWPAAAG